MAEPNHPTSQQADPSTSSLVDKAVPSTLSAQIDLLVALHLWSWPALTLAIQNNWGGSAQVSMDKRDWLAGAVSELLTSTPPQLADVGDLEEVLLQVMTDEFEVVVDDDSAEEVARGIWSGCAKLVDGDTSGLQALYEKWQDRQKKGGEPKVEIVRAEDKEGEETDWDDEDEDDDDENDWKADRPDVNMDEAPPLVDIDWMPKKASRNKPEPEIDEEGFTKVVGKNKKK
ncbi:Pre-rRNA-processing protein TSR2 [Cladophialophora carrionii]|uniref:Pre-rRNA-processing protein TSR2 n=1 Tax=Cladophialophora carrionii TaxID=86049 RepID=A0A1C1D0I1_9EURO|nr:Pre-rRNA-processing protein TSR2 [Cladophialophora carrionii]